MTYNVPPGQKLLGDKVDASLSIKQFSKTLCQLCCLISANVHPTLYVQPCIKQQANTLTSVLSQMLHLHTSLAEAQQPLYIIHMYLDLLYSA